MTKLAQMNHEPKPVIQCEMKEEKKEKSTKFKDEQPVVKKLSKFM